jgi:hypothetical protein
MPAGGPWPSATTWWAWCARRHGDREQLLATVLEVLGRVPEPTRDLER